jgi:outer membrane protein OmpA-like peptidoglycan-associated protein
MVSKIVALVTLLFVVGLALTDWFVHGHYSDEWRRKSLVEDISTWPGITSLDSFDVKVKSRSAWLYGRVDTEDERQRAMEASLETPGLLTIYNDIRVDRLVEEVLVKLQELMERDGTDGEFGYRVAKDGHSVTLDGWVPKDKPEMVPALEALVSNVPGVRRVINNIQVGPPADAIQSIYDILRLGQIYFDYNKATIRPESMPSLERIAKEVFLGKYPTLRVRIEGHTDSIASEAYNQRLSEARAAAVKNALVEYGVPADRLETVGHGETRPISPNNTPEGRSNNRRIEFALIQQ